MKVPTRSWGYLLPLALTGILLLSSLSCSSTLVTSTYTPNATATSPKNVILIGWDGAQREHVQESLGRGELPNLKQLASEGNLAAIDIYRTTDTKAGWTQVLTGYEPEVTGVFSNGRYQPIPKGYTIFERLEDFFGKDNFITVAVIGKKGHVDDDPPQKRRIKEGDKIEGEVIIENGIKYQLIPGKPYYNASPTMDVFINGLEEDEKVGAKAIELIQHYKDKPFFFFVHFAQVDHKGHQFGESSKEYNDALVSADIWTGKIMQKLKELNLYDKTLIYVTADHGFDEGQKSHNDAPYVFLGTNDPKVMRRGQRADITPTILDRFGLDLNKIQPPFDGHPLTKPYQPPLWEPLPSVAESSSQKSPQSVPMIATHVVVQGKTQVLVFSDSVSHWPCWGRRP
ncbi:MAG: alkaline phosphatase family protein [Chloroflexota bacterium]